MIPAVIALTQGGAETGRRILGALGEGELHGRAGRVEGAGVTFGDTVAHVQSLFRAGRPIIGVCAAGILIRALAPLLSDKRAEPPVLAVVENGSAVVPLLGGHRGGNRLARRVAGVFEATAVVTTAGDVAMGVALDDPPEGWRLANPEHAKDVAAALLAGATASVDGHAPWLRESGLPLAEEGGIRLRVTEKAEHGDARTLIYHPAVLAVGVGCERGAEPQEVVHLVRRTLDEAGLAEEAVTAVVSLDLKMDEPAVHTAAAALGVPARFFDAARLEAETPRLSNPSEAVYREVGCHGVAEGAALSAVGEEGELVVAKRKSRRATCAIARAPHPLSPETIGRARGRLAIVGLGPGARGWRTEEVARVLAGASDVVGYSLYLELLGDLAAGRRRHAFDLGEEEARAYAALDLAAKGRSVALVCSGDPGIYAMASPVFELLEREGRADWARSEITVVPGISALQAAAARVGAPLGHDFCAISLSDLLTPWEVIARRLKAAAEGDFVVALYNPVSRRRNWQLAEAARILAAHRPADTPVVLARNLGREGERVEVIDLSELTPKRVDMLTVVLVGTSETRKVPRGDGAWVYTPRGYAAKSRGGSGEAA